jgi:hypothetical protein
MQEDAAINIFVHEGHDEPLLCLAKASHEEYLLRWKIFAICEDLPRCGMPIDVLLDELVVYAIPF